MCSHFIQDFDLKMHQALILNNGHNSLEQTYSFKRYTIGVSYTIRIILVSRFHKW